MSHSMIESSAYSRRNISSECGSAAIEFALILPVLIGLLLGTLASFDDYRASQMVSRAAVTTVDLVTRLSSMDDDMSAKIYASAQGVTGTFSHALDLAVVISSISFSEKGGLTLEWSISNKTGKELKGGDVKDLDLPEMADGDTIIAVTVNAKYTPFIDVALFSDSDLSVTQFRRPRFVRAVEFVEK
jgi:Flp pilus assembly protein TadG